MFVSPQRSYVEALTLSVAVFEDGTSEEVIKIMRVGPWTSRIGVLVKRDIKELVPSLYIHKDMHTHLQRITPGLASPHNELSLGSILTVAQDTKQKEVTVGDLP